MAKVLLISPPALSPDSATRRGSIFIAGAPAMNIDPRRVALSGDSAGGLISSTLAITLRDKGGVQPAAMCLAYPWVTTNDENQSSLETCANTFPLTTTTMHGGSG